MQVIITTNVNRALAAGLQRLLDCGVEEPSRNGPVLVSPEPVTTKYLNPLNRVLFSPLRDANPFFHLFESLWMLAGRNDIAFPVQFNSKFGAYSDDGKTQRGAYGHRWRAWFGYDQLDYIVKELRSDPASRRCVLAMWDGGLTGYWYDTPGTPSVDDPSGDLYSDTVDRPCNTHIYFRVINGYLDMTVCCRSNDILWGAYGANAVHFSFLQEYMAARIGVQVGYYYQMSNNFHLYTNVIDRAKAAQLIVECTEHNHYRKSLNLIPLVNAPSEFDGELQRFFQNIDNDVRDTYTNLFFPQVAQPMYRAWKLRKDNPDVARLNADSIKDEAWRIACKEWLQRRKERNANAL